MCVYNGEVAFQHIFLIVPCSRLENSFTKQNESQDIGIDRKPTTTDFTIYASSHHPFSCKLAAFNSFIQHLLKAPLSSHNYNKEL